MRDSHFKETGEMIPLGLVDLQLWYTASHWSTLDIKKEGSR